MRTSGLLLLLQFLMANFLYQPIATGQRKIELYHCMGVLPPLQQKAMGANNIKQAPLIDGRFIDPTNKDIFDSVSFKNGIIENFPNASDTGVGIIDWETASFDNLLFKPANSSQLQQSIDLFSKILTLAKELRPKVRWGIYNLPYYSYWQRDNKLWLEQGNLLKPLLEKTDLLMISLYDFYKDGSPSTDDKAYIQDNVKMSLQIAELLKKPLFVFIWQRYHASNPHIGLQLIPQKEFVLHIDNILQTEYHGLYVNGLIWFDAQNWFYKVKASIAKTDMKILGVAEQNTKDAAIQVYGATINERVKAAM